MYRNEKYENEYDNRSPRSRGYDERDDERGGRSRTASSRRGFAAMDPDEQREIAREGGRAAHAQGVAHEFTSEEAREAGRRGGQMSRGGRGRDEDYDYESEGRRGERNSSSRRGFAAMDPEERREIARQGGQSRWEESDDDRRGYASRRQDDDYDDYGEDESEDQEGGRMSQRQDRSRRGFASMDPERRREIERRGGEASHGGRGFH